MIILVMSWNTSTAAQVWISWFCHKIVMDVHAWQKTRPTVTNTYHHQSVFFVVVACRLDLLFQLVVSPHQFLDLLHVDNLLILLSTNMISHLLKVSYNWSIPPGTNHLPLVISAATYLVNGILQLLVIHLTYASKGDMCGHALSNTPAWCIQVEINRLRCWHKSPPRYLDFDILELFFWYRCRKGPYEAW